MFASKSMAKCTLAKTMLRTYVLLSRFYVYYILVCLLNLAGGIFMLNDIVL